MRFSDPTIARAWTFVAQRTNLIWCVCVCYKIENVKEQNQGEAESQSIQRERKHPWINVLQHRERKKTAPRRGWITINTKRKKTSLNNFGCRVCVVQHGHCQRAAPRRGWKTIHENGKKTSLSVSHTCVCEKNSVGAFLATYSGKAKGARSWLCVNEITLNLHMHTPHSE